MNPTRVILCEGYDDRAFLSGWLKQRGWADLRIGVDALGPPSTGQFRYQRGVAVLRVVPTNGRGEITKKARSYFDIAPTKVPEGFDRLVVIVDPDDGPSSSVGDLEQQLRQGCPPGLSVCVTGWSCAQASPGFPTGTQNLERVITSALAERHPERADEVSRWLAPGPAEAVPKQHARSWHARWHAGVGCDAFYEYLWSDPELARLLQSRLPDVDAALAALERTS